MTQVLTSGLTEKEIKNIRSDFPHTEAGYTYLNHAAISPLSNSVRTALDRFLDVRNRGSVEEFESWIAVQRQAKEKIQTLINAPDVSRIAFTANTSDGISIVSEGLDWQEGDEVVLNDLEFPANVQPYRALKNAGVRIKYIQSEGGAITPEQVENAITTRTRLLSLSAVQYLSGFKSNLEKIGKICNRHDIVFVVDGIQALGQISTDVQKENIDALATGGHKWLMGPMGIGFLYLSDKLMNRLKPSRTGWLSVEEPRDLFKFDQPWDKTAGRYELGTMNMLGITGLNAAIEKLLEMGISNIESYIHSLARYIIHQLSQLDKCELYTPARTDHHAGIVSFKIPQELDPKDLVNSLKKDKIIISQREGFLRIAPHFYNTEEEIDVVFDRLKSFL